jgi:hypothetical protein
MHPLNIRLLNGNRKIENMCVREREKKLRIHTHVVPERRTAFWSSKHTARFVTLLSIPFTPAATTAAYALNSSPLSPLYTMESH